MQPQHHLYHQLNSLLGLLITSNNAWIDWSMYQGIVDEQARWHRGCRCYYGHHSYCHVFRYDGGRPVDCLPSTFDWEMKRAWLGFHNSGISSCLVFQVGAFVALGRRNGSTCRRRQRWPAPIYVRCSAANSGCRELTAADWLLQPFRSCRSTMSPKRRCRAEMKGARIDEYEVYLCSILINECKLTSCI